MNDKMNRTINTDQLEEVLIAIEKTNFFLKDLLSQYGSGISGDPDSFMRSLNNEPGCTDVEHRTANWILDHERIIGFIDTAQDYILQAEEKVKGLIG